MPIHALLIAWALMSSSAEDAEPINLWIRNATMQPITEVRVRSRSKEVLLLPIDWGGTPKLLFPQEFNVQRYGEGVTQLEWCDAAGTCHLENLILPLCSVCRTWHIGDTVIVSGNHIEYKCECWHAWESFEADESDDPEPEPRSNAPP